MSGGFDRMEERAQMQDRIVHLEKCLQASRIESTWKSSILKRIRDKLINIKDGVKIEDDHALFERGSDAADFVEVVDELDELDWERIAMKGEPVRDYIAELSLANRKLLIADRMNRALLNNDDMANQAVDKVRHRNRELMEANNRYLERARGARNLLRQLRAVSTDPMAIEAIDAELALTIAR